MRSKEALFKGLSDLPPADQGKYGHHISLRNTSVKAADMRYVAAVDHYNQDGKGIGVFALGWIDRRNSVTFLQALQQLGERAGKSVNTHL